MMGKDLNYGSITLIKYSWGQKFTSPFQNLWNGYYLLQK